MIDGNENDYILGAIQRTPGSGSKLPDHFWLSSRDQVHLELVEVCNLFSARDRVMLEYFAKSLKVNRDDTLE